MIRHDFSGQVLNGRYRLISLIGHGGFATVYRAEQIDLKRSVAVKVLNPELSTSPSDQARFKQEAQIAAQIRDRNDHIVKVFEYGRAEVPAALAGYLRDEPIVLDYFVMELLEGRSIRAELERRGWPFTASEALEIVEQICDGLTVAHEQYGVAHRDLKPENIFLEQRRSGYHVKILDLGIAKVVSDHALKDLMRRSETQGIIGTVDYMAPEMLAGSVQDFLLVDIYSLGVCFYEMITLETPFSGNVHQQMYRKNDSVPAALPSVVCCMIEIPPSVEEVIMQCIQRLPARRFQSASELGAKIRELRADSPKSVGLVETGRQKNPPDAKAVASPGTTRASPRSPAADRPSNEDGAPTEVGDLLPPKTAPLRKSRHVGSPPAQVVPAGTALGLGLVAPLSPEVRSPEQSSSSTESTSSKLAEVGTDESETDSHLTETGSNAQDVGAQSTIGARLREREAEPTPRPAPVLPQPEPFTAPAPIPFAIQLQLRAMFVVSLVLLVGSGRLLMKVILGDERSRRAQVFENSEVTNAPSAVPEAQRAP